MSGEDAVSTDSDLSDSDSDVAGVGRHAVALEHTSIDYNRVLDRYLADVIREIIRKGPFGVVNDAARQGDLKELHRRLSATHVSERDAPLVKEQLCDLLRTLIRLGVTPADQGWEPREARRLC